MATNEQFSDSMQARQFLVSRIADEARSRVPLFQVAHGVEPSGRLAGVFQMRIPLLFLLLFTLLFSQTILAQDPQVSPRQEAPAQWVPITAETIQITSSSSSMIPLTVRCEGIYAGNSMGSTYQRLDCVAMDSQRLPVVGTLIDRPSHSEWTINYQKKTVTIAPLLLENHPELAATPMTREIFAKALTHALPIGRKRISGIECKGYRIPDSRNKKLKDEVWYAPSLNFLAVEYRYPNAGGGEVMEHLKDIEIGTAPDPTLFQIPPGFKVSN